MTFMVASSPALLSSPDIDGGLGTRLPPGYKSELLPPEDNPEYWLTSSKASAAPRTIYWTASFTRNLRYCDEPPVTFTLPARALTVVPAPPTAAELAAKKKQEEEAAAKKRKETEAVATPTGGVSLAGSTIDIQSGGAAAVKLTCTGAGTGTCHGKLTLIVKKGKKTQSKTTRIATATFSISAGKTATVELKFNAAGRALLDAPQGRLSATPTILKSSPAPSQTHAENVQLVREKHLGNRKK